MVQAIIDSKHPLGTKVDIDKTKETERVSSKRYSREYTEHEPLEDNDND